ncbi:MAG: Ig-like domain-containing protein [Propionibacteriaceae bacterium]|nr:Ig-like domain-containing protein [Propionibacteriaceae bacterium]
MNSRVSSLLIAFLALAVLVTGCATRSSTLQEEPPGTADSAESAAEEPSPTPEVGELSITSSTDAAIPNDPVTLSLEHGAITDVTVTGPTGAVPGSYADGAWTPSEALAYDSDYTITVTTADGATRAASIHTVAPGSAEASFQVLYLYDDMGVGMPGYVKFNKPVPEEYRAAIEKRALVQTEPQQEGAWGWFSDTELIYRPKDYWQPGTKVHLDLNWSGVQASDDTWLLKDIDADFSIGDVSRIIKVDIANHTTTVVENGETVSTLPSTTGKPGFETRSGTKLILEKHDSLQMNSETIAIPSGSAESYDLNVKWAMRVTWTGEFIHAAPWSVADQGKDNVSHGCVGLSTDNAGWLYSRTNVGDVVEFTGSDRAMEPQEGMGVWLYSWDEWRALSALES